MEGTALMLSVPLAVYIIVATATHLTIAFLHRGCRSTRWASEGGSIGCPLVRRIGSAGSVIDV
jgi:hypothetical protein